jgi:hypothetical protein
VSGWPEPERGVCWLDGPIDSQQQLAAHGVEIDRVTQPERERGHDRFGVVAGAVEAPISATGTAAMVTATANNPSVSATDGDANRNRRPNGASGRTPGLAVTAIPPI